MNKKDIMKKAKLDAKGRCSKKTMKECNCPVFVTQCCTRRIERIMDAINELDKQENKQ
jgi:hypothetical protein